jgi:hypothetical protein
VSARRSIVRRRRRCALGLLALAVLAPAILIGIPGTGGGSRASAQAGEPGETTPETDASVPAREVTMIGSDASGETLGLGQENGATALVRYTPEGGWTLGGALLDASGEPLTGFELDIAEGFLYPFPNPLAAQVTANGSAVLAGCTECATPQQMLLVRDPGGSFKETSPLPTSGEVALAKGEQLLGNRDAPLVAALEESDGKAGALIVPVDEEDQRDERVLHWNGEAWSSEPIEVPAASAEEFQVIGISASSPEDAWLIARLSSAHYPGGSVALFRRELGSGSEPTTWRAVKTTREGESGEPLAVPIQAAPDRHEQPFTVPQRYQSQALTATGEGVWIDGERTGTQVTLTMLFKPAGAKSEGEVLSAWCNIPGGSSVESCEQSLPEPLPIARSRSFAWAEPSNRQTLDGQEANLGERVITGFPEGVSLRLEGEQFKRVLALGGGLPAQANDVGGTFGSAFSNAHEGWLGQQLLPVHLTPARSAAKTRLESWPVPFHHALVALAPEPQSQVGLLKSEVLAVGDEGEVARYREGQGWLPESLLGPGGRHETPVLGAVAWPTPSRAYAVGASFKNGEPATPMWLWRGETGLWEPDPATPLNFRGNLLGIAFQEGEPARGYAVGQAGVLLSYGKTWTQEPACGPGVPEPCIPVQVAGASFTSIAFAGAEAIVAYRKFVPTTQSYEGGLLVNNGSSWQIDEGAAKAMGSNVPWAVAALADGGAAFGAGSHVYERESATAPWLETPTPYPGDGSPGSLALFREDGAVRVIATGTAPQTIVQDEQSSPPPGSPPVLAPPYLLESSQERGVLRQTADGWSDEEHELNNVEQPPGQYSRYDSVYQPDAVGAVLVNEAGTEGWAVGGNIGVTPAMDTSDAWRYPAEGGAAHVLTEEIPAEPGTTLAFGGDAHCEAPCAERAKARIGPDVWLSNAFQEAELAHASAFFYTGYRVTQGRTNGPATQAIPTEEEIGRYSELLEDSPIVAYAAPSPTDVDPEGSERQFGEAFKRFPFHDEADCERGTGAGACYYSHEVGGVQVIVIDGSEQERLNPEQFNKQLTWLKEELANTNGKPAIVVGSADLEAQIEAGGALGERAKELSAEIVKGNASAYFFDSQEQNVQGKLELPTLPGEPPNLPVETFGSGTLGYISEDAQELSDFLGASGFLLVDVGALQTNHRAKINVKLIPDIGELALEGKSGTLLRRSQPAEFAGLARRPRSGNDDPNGATTPDTDPYIPIPDECIGADCEHGKFPEYEFRSSNPEVGMFVKKNPGTRQANAVEQSPDGKPSFEGKVVLNPKTGLKEQEEARSGLFCALNKGTTIVTIVAGGLKAELPVTVQSGSPEQPCGTVPAVALPAKPQTAPVPTPAPSPTPAGPAPASAPPLLPLPPLPPVAAARPVARPVVPPLPFFLPQPGLAALIPFVPLPVPTPARPTPPSGTSAVTSPVEAPEKEEEQEAAPESVSNEASAYHPSEHEPAPEYILGIVVLAAFAGASARRRPGRRRRELRVAPATISAMRAERRANRRDRFR